MLEYPSGKMVLSKGWDVFNHAQDSMAVPCFSPWLNGKDLGDVWFDIPNYQDGEQGALNTEFGFYVSHPGIVDLRLVVVEAHRRDFHWGMLETLRIGPDSRKSVSVAPLKSVRANPLEPWLFLNGRAAHEVRARFRANKNLRAPMARMLKLMKAGHVVPYVSTEQAIAAAAFLTGSPEWIALAKKRLRELCAMPTWSGRKNPRVMQGDNDMGRAYNLMAVSMFANYLWDKLDLEERELAKWKAREYGRRLYEFSVLNKRWAAGMAFLRTREEKPRLCCVYQSGLGVGRHGFKLRNRYAMECHSPNANGSVYVLVNGAFVIMSNPGCYRKGFQNESVVTVAGAGHFMDGRWLGCDIKENWISKMLSFRNDPPRRLVLEVVNPDRYRIRIVESQMVLPYIYGMNTGQSKKAYKGIGTSAPPRPQFLEIAVPGTSRAAHFCVEMKPA